MTTARRRLEALLSEDGFTPEDMARFLGHAALRGTMIRFYRTRRAAALRKSGLVETVESEREGEMVRALLAVGGEA